MLAILLITANNVLASFKDIWDLHTRRQRNPYFFSGTIFSGLKKILKESKYVGYYTDKSMDLTPYAAQFAQAQYILAPIILDFNNTDHEFIFFDCLDEKAALKKIKEIKAIPFKKNKFGIMLATKIRSNPSAPAEDENSFSEESSR